MAAPRNQNIKEKVLECTETLLEKKSFSEITLSDIAKASRISKGTLYYYYSNKNDILFDITDRYLKSLSNSLISWLEDKNKDTCLQRFLTYTFLRGIDDQGGNLRIYLISDAISGNEHIRSRFLEKYAFFKKTLAEQIKQRMPEVDSEYVAWLILTVMDGLLIQHKLQNPDIETEKFIANTVEVVKNIK